MIPEVEAFKAAYEAEREANKKTRDLELDIRIAERNGEPTDEIEKAKTDHISDVWYPAYQQRAEALKALFDTLGLDPDMVKRVLP